MLKFSRFFIKWRGVNLVLIGGATLFFAYHALQLQVFSQFIDLLPRNHPFIQIYEKYNRGFGSANVVVAAIVAKDGNIYDERVLEKVYAFTDQIDKIEGVDHGQVASMTAVTVRDTGIDQSGTIRTTQVVGEEPLALLETQFFTRRTVHREPGHHRDRAGDRGGEPREVVGDETPRGGVRQVALVLRDLVHEEGDDARGEGLPEALHVLGVPGIALLRHGR